MDPFDLTGPLPTGTTLLEASAGTGKTFTVAALVTRYVAEGAARLEELLVITFGRAASQELRERVRAQLVEAERALAAEPTDATSRGEPGNELLALLLDADATERAARRHRLREALASFDAATIATTHQFCQLVLRSLGVAGDSDPGVRLVDDLDDLVIEVVDDVYLRRFGQATVRPPFDRAAALTLAREAVGDPQAMLAPDGLDPASPAGARVRFAREVRAELERRKRRQGILSYDDLLSRLATALAADDAPARQRMRQRWRVVLVDEFQDTDPVQWQVIDRAFTGHATVVLIGDPKQAIYAFRGGDVPTYLQAATTATTQATLGTNWRSDQALVDRLQVVLRGAELGDAQITVHPVTAHHPGSRLAGAGAPWRLRMVDRDGFRLSKHGDIAAADARDHIATDCARDIAALLASGATYDGRPLRAADIAVLVAVREHGHLVQRRLAECGVPAVVAGGGHVLLTPAGDEVLALLEALETPQRSGRVRAAAITPFFGETTATLVAGGDELTDRVADVLRGWALLLRGRGVAALFEAAEERGLTPRVLAETEGERHLTDLRHIAQVLHEVASRERLGLTAMVRWLRDERLRNAPTSERTRRLDSDAAAVQIATIHASKGLQYPVVYLPFGYQRHLPDVGAALFHDDEGVRTLDVAGSGPQWADHVQRHQHEQLGEELRLLYVALTRAQSQVVTWWAPTVLTPTGGLHRLLVGRPPGSGPVPDRVPLESVPVADRVAEYAARGGPSIETALPALPPTAVPVPAAGALTVRHLDRRIDQQWRRTSYSGLIRIEETAPLVDSEPEVDVLDDEPAEEPVVEPGSGVEVGFPVSPMAELPAGAAFGSLVHGVLERTDPQAPDLRAELHGHVVDQLRWWPVAATADDLTDALLPTYATPLGPLCDGLTLADVGRRDRLCELDFEFPLAGGDRVTATAGGGGAHVGEVWLRDVADLWQQLLPGDDPLAAYAHRLARAPLGDQELRGYLSGSIDVVLRIPGADGPRYVVSDYKTNLLGEPGAPVTAAAYTQPRLAEAMLHSHYPLQALLYSVVLHRFLRWRQPGYDPGRHLGGVVYLYLRGLCGPDTPVVDGQPTGVFAWSPPSALITGVSDLLAGGAS